MLIYALFNEEGAPRGFFHKEDPKEQPEGTVLITEDQWRDLYQNQSTRRWNGKKVVAFKPRPVVPEITVVSAAQAQTALFNANLLDRVEEVVANHPYRPVKIFYERANTWEITNPYVQAIALDLGLIKVDADGNHDISALQALFLDASKL